ncbi:MAG: zinc ribbon domain-containing protein [Candidatus Micrarchaeota archaeon]
MGIGDVIGGMLSGKKSTSGKKMKCPNCGADVTLDMERCQKCGVRIKSMFRRKCPKCETLNEIDADNCVKCGYNFEAERAELKRTYYVCPICGFKSEAFLTQCPACNTKFV